MNSITPDVKNHSFTPVVKALSVVTSVALCALGGCCIAGVLPGVGLTYGILMVSAGALIGTVTTAHHFCHFQEQSPRGGDQSGQAQGALFLDGEDQEQRSQSSSENENSGSPRVLSRPSLANESIGRLGDLSFSSSSRSSSPSEEQKRRLQEEEALQAQIVASFGKK